MATPSGSNATISSGDPSRKYGTQDPKVRNNITCNFCGKVCKAGISRLKQNLVGGFKDVSDFPKCPSHVREEMKTYMKAKEMSKVENVLKSTIQLDDYDLDGDKDCEEIDVSNVAQRKKARVKGPMDMFFSQVRKETSGSGRQQTINEVCNKELREKACRDVTRWFYDAGIPFNAATF
ncbi:hypothetical protein E3N88_35010 [Mikania micrantha]|uniref:BED-type domain-containing protein n=1 Tax=Mikania micrantha TaxID=192012 RepID=A0A5N6LZS0_9ASTR|nr:hypothetical protein E3N88_35010 [Mikania micrantha]